jgi:mRNA interferase MazF
VLVPRGVGGLPQDAVALCHQLRVLDRSGIGARIGTLPLSVLRQIEQTVRVTLGV